MEKETLRDRLLTHLPDPARAEAYREEVQTALGRHTRRLRYEKWFTCIFWVYAISLLMVFLYQGENFAETPHGHSFLIIVTLVLGCGAVEILKHMINRSRVEMLTEIKQVQLQVLELQTAMQRRNDSPPVV